MQCVKSGVVASSMNMRAGHSLHNPCRLQMPGKQPKPHFGLQNSGTHFTVERKLHCGGLHYLCSIFPVSYNVAFARPSVSITSHTRRTEHMKVLELLPRASIGFHSIINRCM